MRTIRNMAAVALLIAILVVSAFNVSVADQRDRFRHKVRALSERVTLLETQIGYLHGATRFLDGGTGIYRGRIRARQVRADGCPDGAPVLWEDPPDDVPRLDGDCFD